MKVHQSKFEPSLFGVQVRILHTAHSRASAILNYSTTDGHLYVFESHENVSSIELHHSKCSILCRVFSASVQFL
jgi:hypothetical protein